MYHKHSLDAATLNAFLAMPAAEGTRYGVSFLGNEWSLGDLLDWYEGDGAADDFRRRLALAERELACMNARADALLTAMAAVLGIAPPQDFPLPQPALPGTIGTPDEWAAAMNARHARGKEIGRILTEMKAKHGEAHPLMELFHEQIDLRRTRETQLHRLSQLARSAESTPRPAKDVILPRGVRFPEPAAPASQATRPGSAPLPDDHDTL